MSGQDWASQMRHLTRRRLSASLGAGCSTLLLAACGESVAPPAATPSGPTAPLATVEQRGPAALKGITADQALSAAPATPIPATAVPAGATPSTPAAELSLWIGPGVSGQAAQVLDASLPQFSAAHEAVSVTLQPKGRRDDQLKDAISAGTPPNVAAVASWDAADLATTGATLDLAASISLDNEWAGWQEDVFPELRRAYTWKDRLTAVPWWVTALGMLANPDHLTEAGVTAPEPVWSWQDFLETGRSVTQPPDRYALGPRWTWSWFEAWLLSNGATLFSQDTARVQFDSPEAMEAMAFIQGFIEEGLAPASDSPGLFRRRRATFDHAGLSDVALYRQRWRKEHPVIVLNVPRQQGALVRGESQGLIGIRADGAAQNEAALALVRWLTNPEQTMRLSLAEGTVFSPYATASTAAETVAYGREHSEWQFFYELAAAAAPSQAVPSSRAIQGLMTKWVQQVLGKQVALAEGLQQGQREMQQFLDRDHQES